MKGRDGEVSAGALRHARAFLGLYFGRDDFPKAEGEFLESIESQFERLYGALQGVSLEGGDPAVHAAVARAKMLVRDILLHRDNRVEFIKNINLQAENLGVNRADLKSHGMIF